MAKFPSDSEAVERPPETDEETIRRQPVRGMIRRMGRNKLVMAATLPAQTPYEVMLEWAAELTTKPSPADLADLSERLRDTVAFEEEDGAIAGHRVVASIDRQADRTCDWTLKSRLRLVAANVETVLREMGLL